VEAHKSLYVCRWTPRYWSRCCAHHSRNSPGVGADYLVFCRYDKFYLIHDRAIKPDHLRIINNHIMFYSATLTTSVPYFFYATLNDIDDVMTQPIYIYEAKAAQLLLEQKIPKFLYFMDWRIFT
jgi:hypothetical protein